MSTDSAILIVLSTPPGAQGATRWLLEKRPLTLGRHLTCEIYLPDRQISREHARIFQTADGFFVEDLVSKNGTFVNGEPVHTPTRLKDGDILQIGLAYRLSFVEAESTVPLPDNAEDPFALRLDPDKKLVWVGGRELDPPLSPAQFDVLQLLMDAQGGIVERDEVAQTVWGSLDGVTEQAIDALVRRLRRRLADVDPTREFVVTVRGYGFRLEL